MLNTLNKRLESFQGFIWNFTLFIPVLVYHFILVSESWYYSKGTLSLGLTEFPLIIKG
jgi:hypothetical protein